MERLRLKSDKLLGVDLLLDTLPSYLTSGKAPFLGEMVIEKGAALIF